MLMVIFGAGASYDSAPDQGIRRPPLAAELTEYPSVAAKYPASRAVIDYLDRAAENGSTSLEAGLAAFAELAERSTDRMMQLTAFRFYLCEVIQNATRAWLDATHGRTYYLALFNYLLEWQERSKEPIRIVTFNYDTLIEDALGSLFTGWRFDSIASYVSRRDWTLMKLHGSITWSRVGGSATKPGRGEANIDRAIAAANQLASPDLEFAVISALDMPSLDNRIYFPALAVPMANKTSFECPSLHIDALKSCFPEVNRVLICGWRAAESHAVNILSGINPGYQLGIVAGSRADVAEVHTNLAAAGRKGMLVLDQRGGMTSFASDMENQLLPLLAGW
jgi:hypothetical protein